MTDQQPWDFIDAVAAARRAAEAQKAGEKAVRDAAEDLAEKERAYRLGETRMTAPYGYCHCGCGEKTRIAPQNKTCAGWVKGEPLRYLKGHALRGLPPWNLSSVAPYRVDPETGCWVWLRHKDNKGYGVSNRDGRPLGAYRLYYEQANGPVPEGLQIDHLCRNRACVNPAHLEAVTAAENVRRRPATRLTPETVRAIRASDEPGVVLAKRFGISQQQVCNVRKGRVWADVEAA